MVVRRRKGSLFLLRVRAAGIGPIAAFGCTAEFGRYRGIADIGRAGLIALGL
jgi:hypothetical protein